MRQTSSGLAYSFALAAALAGTAAPVRAAEPVVQLFADTCANCHTVGGGELVGPDLVSAATMDHATLRQKIVEMEDYAGPLTGEQIEALIDLLTAPDAATRIAAVSGDGAAGAAEPAPEETGDPERGAALFTGRLPFANGGLPCAACHRAAAGPLATTGGTLAKDLADAARKLGRGGLAAAAEKAAFPVMRGAYRDHPVTHDEALDLAAFLAPAPSGPPATPTEGEKKTVPFPLGPWAGGLAVVCLAAIGLAYRRRGLGTVGPRRRLLLEAERRRRKHPSLHRAAEELR